MRQMTDRLIYQPAVSRVAYRLQRLWLTHSTRISVKFVVPTLVMAVLASWYIDVEAIKRSLLVHVETIRSFVTERPEFMIRFVSIDGAGEASAARIRQILPVRFPVSTFELDLDQIQSAVESLDVIASAEVRIRPGDILHIEVTERIPVAIWRMDDTLQLLSEDGGFAVPLANRADRGDLPLIAGEGADTAVTEALAIVAALEPLQARLRGLVRVGERRWDVILDRDQRIMLPETGAIAVLERVIALDQNQYLLARDIAAVDMRNPRRQTARVRQGAVEEMRRIKALEAGVSDR